MMMMSTPDPVLLVPLVIFYCQNALCRVWQRRLVLRSLGLHNSSWAKCSQITLSVQNIS